MDAIMWICCVSLAILHSLAWYLLLVVLVRICLAMTEGVNLCQLLADYCRRTTDSLVGLVERRLGHIEEGELRRITAWLDFLILLVSANVVTGTLVRALPASPRSAHRAPAVAAAQPHLGKAATPAPGSTPAAPP